MFNQPVEALSYLMTWGIQSAILFTSPVSKKQQSYMNVLLHHLVGKVVYSQ
jgi:hypothetical protein